MAAAVEFQGVRGEGGASSMPCILSHVYNMDMNYDRSFTYNQP